MDDVEHIISARRYRPPSDDRPLFSREKISDVWPEQPPDNHLHIFVSLPGGVGNRSECGICLFVPTQYLMNTLPEGELKEINHLPEYKDLFIKVNNWGTFERSDIKRNQLEDTERMIILNFVTTFEQKLVRKPRLHPDVCCLLDLSFCCSILTGRCRCMLHCGC